MNKIIIILSMVTLLASNITSAHNGFQPHSVVNPMYDNGFQSHSVVNPMYDNGFWKNFHQQFKQFDQRINNMQRNSMQSNSRQYFDKASNNYVVEIKALGLNKNNLNISSNNNMLTIKSISQDSKTSGNQNSFSSMRFSQTLTIPSDGDTNNIQADFKDGTLKVSIPKLKKSAPVSKRIIIN